MATKAKATAAGTGEVKSSAAGEIVITKIREQTLRVFIVGTTPLLMNQFNQKAWDELLAPSGKKNAAEKASTLKHDPRQEFRDSVYTLSDNNAPTFLAVLPTAIKRSMMTAALDLPGTKKAQIGRLISVPYDRMPVWGIPKLHAAMVRMADMARTPDVRSRACIEHWACQLDVTFPTPTLRETSVMNLLHAAGRYAGICEWRQEKGSGSFGSFRICETGAEDEEFQHIVKTGGRKAQLDAMKRAEPFDDDTAALLARFDVTVRQRGFMLKEAA